jgi:FtsH-binding integral membrane protein
MSTWTKNQLLSLFGKLPLWAKVALPIGIILLVVSLLKMLKTIVLLAAIGLIVFGLLSVYDTWKKEDVKKAHK